MERERSFSELRQRTGVGEDHHNGHTAVVDIAEVADIHACEVGGPAPDIRQSGERDDDIGEGIGIDRHLAAAAIGQHKRGRALVHSAVV